jgi:hypothetical protein
MKRGVGWFMVIVGMIALGTCAFVFTAYRFRNETLTETQLAIWCFQRWWAWVPAVAVAGIGMWIVGQPRDSLER